jgi:protease IV
MGLLLALAVFFVLVLVLSSSLRKGDGISLADKIAVVPVTGVITDSRQVLEQLNDFKTHTSVKAIVVRIDSPGGGVGPSQEIFEEIKKVRKVKKVVASIGSVGASGGYYVACASDRVVANPGALVGSIGVIVEFANFEELLQKIGVKGVVLKSGKYKDVLSPIREITEEEKALVQNVIDNVHQQFVNAVTEERRLTPAQVEAVADARIFTGLQARDLGLVDQLGNFHDAVDLAAKMAGIEGEPQLLYAEKKLPWMDYFMEQAWNKLEEKLFVPYKFSFRSLVR